MPDCEYCSASFDGEDAYLDHLAAEHEGELGSIDERRVADHEAADGLGVALGPAVLVALVVFAGGLVVYVTFLMGGGGGLDPVTANPSGLEAKPLPTQGADQRLQGVETFDSAGRRHVEPGTSIDYERTPPLSGTHYLSPASPGFYTTRPEFGNLVHSLEHGAVVIYYDPSALTESARQSLKEFAGAHDSRWKAVIAVPHPSDNPPAPYVLTAWTTRLRMDEYDPKTVRAFIAEYIARGPENPLR